jgi:hypothetical protein
MLQPREEVDVTRTIGLALSLVLTLFVGGVSAADQCTPVRQISVSGTVETKMSPDRVFWAINLRDTHKILAEAKRRNDEKVKAVLALRDKLKLGQGDLETGQVSISREYEQTRSGERGDFKHFVVSRSLSIRQRDLRQFDQFLDALVASTDMEVGFNLESSRAQQLRAEARLKALEVARNKAAAMAAALGAKLGRVLKIEEHAQREPWQDGTSNTSIQPSAPSVDLGSETFVPGALSVRATVYVTFELQ